MKSLFSLPTLLTAALLSIVVSVPFLPLAAPATAHFHFDITLTSTAPGSAQLFFDIGRGINEADSKRATVENKTGPQFLSFPLPPGNYRALRLDPIDRTAEITLSEAVIRTRDGRVVQRFALGDFTADNQIFSLVATGDALRLITTAGATDPNLGLRLAAPFELVTTLGQNLRTGLKISLGVFFIILAAVGLVARSRDALCRSWTWLTARPIRAVSLMAVVAVIASSYPVLFFGKSIVSPNNGTTLLYENFPTLPGYRDRATANVAGADIGAIMWQHIPLSMLQRDALLSDGELPLWNRYNSAGTVLLGQGQSMFGDPLHF